ncbi:MAG: hypothetical protein P8P16_09170 [Amylibacter sp.]|nr:hypothetical protein [Amylibacter sp.]
MHETTSPFITYSVFMLVIEAFAGQMHGFYSVRPFQMPHGRTSKQAIVHAPAFC